MRRPAAARGLSQDDPSGWATDKSGRRKGSLLHGLQEQCIFKGAVDAVIFERRSHWKGALWPRSETLRSRP
jgi:hypothetical protein